ncbi:MAG TPA: hypothetical protein VG897_01980 [Terriglobales bacterium]|nr:hypothetical protein [Terriglobales bacterium]
MDELVPVRGSFGTKEFLIGPLRPQEHPATFKLSSGLNITESGWRSLLAAENVVGAKSPDSSIVGLHIANHYSLIYEGEQLRQLRAAASVLCNRFKLDQSSIAFGSQSVIVPEFTITDLREHLLRSLLRTVGFRYRHLFSFCRKNDPEELETLQLQGWRCYQEEDDVCYLMLNVAKTLRGLASQLVLRIPPRPQMVARATGTR